MEASHRPQQAQYFSSSRKVQNGLPCSRGFGVVDRPFGVLSSYQHPPSFKEVPSVQPQISIRSYQFTSLPFDLTTAPHTFTMIVKEVKFMALSEGSESKLKPTQVFSFVGYEYHLDLTLVKPTPDRWLQAQDLIQKIKSKPPLTTRRLMSLIGLLTSMEKMVPEGRLYMRPFHWHLKEHWRFPQSLDTLLPWLETFTVHLEWWQNPVNLLKGSDLHPKDHNILIFTDASNVSWDTHLEQNSIKDLWSDRKKRLHKNVLELKQFSWP